MDAFHKKPEVVASDSSACYCRENGHSTVNEHAQMEGKNEAGNVTVGTCSYCGEEDRDGHTVVENDSLERRRV